MMNIGEAAKLSQVNAKMIRRCEEQGIIPKAGRSFPVTVNTRKKTCTFFVL
ncbi:MAG: MerR family DNA-binding transcriptional regulator [Bacteriovoracaceae bacterium]|nr:MerR family DNA-binding transcriptional regulator [Bacteriovoracaceae bacterium]